MSNEILRAEFAGSILGVSGRFMNVIGEPGASVVRNQKFVTQRRPANGYGAGVVISATVRFDDECKNGHNTFSITADIRKKGTSGDRGWIAGGCCHEDIAKAFPEFAPLIKWHLTSGDGPLHYIANTIYHAGDRDHNGKRAGEAYAWDDATDAELMQEPEALRAALTARHPALMAEFRAAMDACGFMWGATGETPPPAEWNGATARQRVGGTFGT